MKLKNIFNSRNIIKKRRKIIIFNFFFKINILNEPTR